MDNLFWLSWIHSLALYVLSETGVNNSNQTKFRWGVFIFRCIRYLHFVIFFMHNRISIDRNIFWKSNWTSKNSVCSCFAIFIVSGIFEVYFWPEYLIFYIGQTDSIYWNFFKFSSYMECMPLKSMPLRNYLFVENNNWVLINIENISLKAVHVQFFSAL